MALRRTRGSATSEAPRGNPVGPIGPCSCTDAMSAPAPSPLPSRIPTTIAQSPRFYADSSDSGGRHFDANAFLSLDALTTKPEVQELFRKAADWRAKSTNGHDASKTSPRLGDSAPASRSPNQGIRLTPTPRTMAPQVTAGSEVEMPLRCLVRPEIHSEPCGCHASQGDDCGKRSVNSPGGHISTALACLNSSAKRCNTPVDETPQDPYPNTKNTNRTMPDPEHSPRAEEDEPGLSSTSKGREPREEVHTPLSFQIPEETLRAALDAEPDSAASFYNQNMYRGPDEQLLSIHYCHSMEVATRVLPYFLEETVLGFDIEWKPFGKPESIKENVSLIQIASEDRIALFHISQYRGTTPEELLPSGLKTIIESPDILKVGVAIKGDFSRVAKYLGVKPRGVFELSRLHNLVENYKDNPSKAGSRALFALAKQVQQHLQLPMYKGAVRESDWSKRLRLDQMAYAATDAYASLRIYDALEEKRKALQPIPPRPAVCDDDEPSRPSRPKTTLRSRPALEATAARAKGDDAAQERVEQSDEETSAYETAAEDLVDSHELEDSSDAETSTAGAKACHNRDANYLHPRVGQPQLESHLDPTSVLPPMTRQRRCVGRVKLGALKGTDPAYPNLPSPLWEGESEDFVTPYTLDSAAFSYHEQAAEAFDAPTTRTFGSDAEGQSSNSRAEPKHLQGHLSSINLGHRSERPVTLSKEGGRKRPKNEDGASSSKGQSRPEMAKEINHVSANGPSSSRLSSASESAATSTGTSIQTPRNWSVKFADASTGSPSESFGPALPRPMPTFKPLQAEPPHKSAEYTAAESWAQAYLFSSIPSASATASIPQSKVRATLSHLRAYHLWHHQHMGVDEVSRQLRDPPLAESTVCGYILQAIALERLEYRKEDVRQVLRALPTSLRMTRWKFLIEKVGGV